MKKYIEFRYELSVVDGKRTWINPKETGKEPVMDETHAELINDQFVNTGVKLELKPEEPARPEEDNLVNHVLTEADLENNPELAEQGFKVGDTVKIPAPSSDQQ